MSDSEKMSINLCVPEDAFEQFQAVSSYEEEEFITLSDIVEPPKPTLDLNACLDEIKDDVCISSDLDPYSDEKIGTESTDETSQRLEEPVHISSQVHEQTDSTVSKIQQNIQDLPQNIPQIAPKKRGRRKKGTIPTVAAHDHHKVSSGNITSDHNNETSTMEIAKVDISCVTASDETFDELITDSYASGSTNLDISIRRGRRKRKCSKTPAISQGIISTVDDTLKPRKRGRPKKVVTSPDSLNVSSIENVCGHESLSDKGDLAIDIENSYGNDNIMKSSNTDNDSNYLIAVASTAKMKSIVKKTRKRGRPKRTENSDSLNSSTPVIKSNLSLDSGKIEEEVIKNKEDKKKYDDIELELIRMLSTPTKEMEEKNDAEEVNKKVKIPKTRGSKSKKLKDELDTSVLDPNFQKSQDNEIKDAEHIEQGEDDADDICLSSLKKQFNTEDAHKEENTINYSIETEPIVHNVIETKSTEVSTKRNAKKAIMSDFEYNVETIVNEPFVERVNKIMEVVDNPEIESPSKRPIRRKAKKILHYDEGSDEDPFANVELSDDDDLSGRGGGKYYSDDEYIPGKRKKGEAYSESESSISGNEDFENNESIVKSKVGRKKGRKLDESRKKYKRSDNNQIKNTLPDVTSTAADTTTQNDDDLENSLQSPDITTNDNLVPRPSQAWGMSHEFENFIAQKIQGTNIKIKKLTGATSNENAITQFNIPVLDPNEPKKTAEMFTQTSKTSNKTVGVQTTSPFERTLTTKVSLTAEQSEKACEFLKGIVKNTSELGQLMIQKSEDFIQKKINIKNVTDTGKLDYCVQKSFLLFKLAKHNLIQMEEDLANEYGHFLKSHKMLKYFETPKSLTATAKSVSSDSDCEIVDEPIQEQKKVKSKFNPKTVFLNKELSIKIAKKSNEEPQRSKEKVSIKGGRHTVWINDAIMVKKVKPTQSFLAQDSRNKKPPDSKISLEMVKNFFDKYNKRQKVLLTCAPLISSEWLTVKQIGICNYFIAESLHRGLSTSPPILNTPQTGSESNNDVVNIEIKRDHFLQPISLQTLCTKAMQRYMSETNSNHKDNSTFTSIYNLPFEQEYQPISLLHLSFNVISSLLAKHNSKSLGQTNSSVSISSLKQLCLRSINSAMYRPIRFSKSSDVPREDCHIPKCNKNLKISSQVRQLTTSKPCAQNFKTLFTSCVEAIQMSKLCIQKGDFNENKLMSNNKMKTLKTIAFENIKQLMCARDQDVYAEENSIGQCSVHFRTITLEQSLPYSQNYPEIGYCMDKADKSLALTIESVNTLSDDIFAKLPGVIDDESPCLEDEDSSSSNFDSYEPAYTDTYQDDDTTEGSNWVSQLQLHELKSCFTPIDNRPKSPISKDSNTECVVATIKIEPLEEIPDNIDSEIIKSEPAENDEETNFNTFVTKVETQDNIESENVIPEHNSSSYDVDAFEKFARTSKILRINEDCGLSDEIFSQSALRVRKQHEPDVDNDLDTSMSLLIPQNIELAKDRLMESSSEGESNLQKNVTKKKRKARTKISRQKNKDISTNKDKPTPENEVALLTRKMQDRIRQLENTDDSSDSELENSLAQRRENAKKDNEKAKIKSNKEVDNHIQCNDVDSTENISEKLALRSETRKILNQKKLPKVFLSKRNRGNHSLHINNSTEKDDSSVIQSDAPVELLECEPTLPMIHDDMEIGETENDEVDEGKNVTEIENHELEPVTPEELQYTERHGWKCYPVNNNDKKLYEDTYILLEKLPESFVETYFRYQGVADKDEDDTDIDRLTNLQSLRRTISKKNKERHKTRKVLPNGQLKSNSTENCSLPSSPADDQYNELTPSEDEEANIDDEVAPAPRRHETENVMAKNYLMNEMDSDSEKLVNTETEESLNKSHLKTEEEPIFKCSRPGPKSKKLKFKENETYLTADKMMNKELALLHAPVTVNAEEAEVKDVTKKNPKNITKSSYKLRTHLERVKHEESSSEEEKQWVNTKEKLLKRIEKKQENPSVDDAKRAKIVSEYIEKRSDAPDKRPIGRPRRKSSRKKFLERQKQMRVLNKELFGDTAYTGRKGSQVFGKGRRNIRKVIDKKSLATSTIDANMEEFARKRRLTMQQTRLREELGCEEGVNVLVINDEVCLEYDFEQMQPVVTVHPFFTKVMKAHQYEGVKFMWDACFESLSLVGAGHAGGGCILAHCMGLGKTLQVLALLHTVLTHPGVGMKRVLVCCPLSTVLNWVDEINKWIGPVTNKIKVFELSKLKKTYERAYQLEDWYKDGGIFIIGYELFRSLTTLDPDLDNIKPKIMDKIRHALLNPGPDVVICDEGHLLKNDASVLAVAMSRVATRRRIVLTGTPMQNNLREYYCMVNFVKPSLLGTYSEFSNRFENPIMNGQHRDSHEEDIKLMKARTHILHKVLEGCLQRQEASVLYPYLPKKREYTVFIPPTKCQWELYKHYIIKYALEQQQNNKLQNKPQKHSVLKDFHVLQKIWTHPQVLHNFLMKARDERNKIKEEKLEDELAQADLTASEDVKPSQTEVWWLQYLAGGDMLHSIDSSNKFVVVFQLLDEFVALGDKALIFSTSLYTMDALEFFLKRINKWSLGQEYYRLDGSVPAEVRQKWCREFNAPHNVNTKLFLISTRAGCLGLNMTAANRVIILDTSWNPAHDIQSIFRVYRFGQKKDCYIYRLVAMGTMEQKIYERSVTKQAVSCRVVDEQQIDRHYNMAELTELYRFDEEGASVEAGLAAGVCDVALLRVAARARLHAVREHDSLLRGSREQHLPEHERNAAWMQFQQEHANNEMQDRLLEASEGIKRILESDLAQPSGSMSVKTEEPPQAVIPCAGTGPKGRKSRKKATNGNPCIEDSSIGEQKELQRDTEKEEAKVKKIMQLLIKHNFHTSRRANEIPQLVSKVRSIVDAGGTGLEHCDELTRSIASVMMQEEDLIVPPSRAPPLSDVITGHSITHRGEVELESEHTIPNVGQEVSIEMQHDTSYGIPDATLDERADDKTILNDSNDASLLVPIMESARRLRERLPKYIEKRPRGRPRKSDASLVDHETPIQIQDSVSPTESIGRRSKRPRGKPRRFRTPDLDESALDRYSSKEQSPEIVEEPVVVKQYERKPRNVSQPPSSISPHPQINLIDDDDISSKDSEPLVVPDIIEEPKEPEIKKPKRAIAVKSTAKVKLSDFFLNGKVKRKAALAAQEHLEKIDNGVIVTLDDDDEEWIDERERKSGRNSTTNKSATPPRAPEHTRRESNTSRDSEIKATRIADSTLRTERVGKKRESILLSDDEDPKLVQANTKATTTRGDESNSRETRPEEAVPLHPSMLKNANFIKIVAYAYQSNQMLDEDAAMLAARYSTQKALKEYEMNGKGINSGPLYDIAVKVLGKDVIKRLNDKKKIKRNETSVTAIDSDSRSSRQGAPDAGQGVTLKDTKNVTKTKEPISCDYEMQPNVVPVGMFKGSTSMSRKTQDIVEECILPDDDDCILGLTNEIPLTQNLYRKPNAQQMLISAVNSSGGGRIVSQPVSTTETIVPEVKQSLTISASQASNLAPSAPKVKPYVTITESTPKYIVPNASTYRISQSNLVIEPVAAEVERPNVISLAQAQPYLTLTISEGKLVQAGGTVNVLNNVQSTSAVGQASNDTICLDSDEEDYTMAPPLGKSAPTTHYPPTPVAVSASIPNLSAGNNVNGGQIVMRVNKKPLSLISSDAQSIIPKNKIFGIVTSNLPNNSNQNNDIKSSKNSKKFGPVPTFTKIAPKPNDSVISETAKASAKSVVTPDAVINGMIKEKQMKKVCKPGDILRITKTGTLEVLSKVDDLPTNLKAQIFNDSSKTSGSKKVEAKPLKSSSTPRPPSPVNNDPLSILKDVIQIQADDYDENRRKTQSITETSKLVASTSKTENIQKTYTVPKKKWNEAPVNSKQNDFAPQFRNKELADTKQMSKPGNAYKSPGGTIDLTNLVRNNKTVAVIHKTADKFKSKGSILVGSSKDIIIHSKKIGGALTKASTSATNSNPTSCKREGSAGATDTKKRTSPWPATYSPKKQRGLLRPAQTLKDFDIDDIDDIIELE